MKRESGVCPSVRGSKGCVRSSLCFNLGSMFVLGFQTRVRSTTATATTATSRFPERGRVRRAKKINSNPSSCLAHLRLLRLKKSWLSINPRPDPAEEGREHHLASGGPDIIRHSKKSLVLCIIGLLLNQCLDNVF